MTHTLEVKELGDSIVNMVKSPVLTFHDDYRFVGTAPVERGILLDNLSALRALQPTLGHIQTKNYSSLQLNGVTNIGSVYALTYEPEGTRVRFAVSFDGHKTYQIFSKRKLLDISSDDIAIAQNGNDKLELCFGFRNLVPSMAQKRVDFKIVLYTDSNESPIFYGFRCSLYGQKN